MKVRDHTLLNSDVKHNMCPGEPRLGYLLGMVQELKFPSLIFVGPYDFGGVLTNTNRDMTNGEGVQKRNQAQKEMHW